MNFSNTRPAFVAAIVAIISSAACGPANDPECYERPDGDGPWVLSDHYHARKQNHDDYVLDKNTYSYQGAFGYRRVFDQLENGGFNTASIREMGLSPERLEGYDTLFINLVSNDRPNFTDDEVETIIDFVEDGGGLFVIADHTNVYDHAERVNRFLKPMGIEVLYHTAVDYPPDYSVAGLGWILVRDFVEHPVTAGINLISLQTGGPMEGGGLAFTSERSFADFWNPEQESGHYGNWAWDGDESVEPRGPLSVYNAVEYGKGRVVVAGDQNMFGDTWAHWSHNFELFMNSMEWVSQHDAGAPLRNLRPLGTVFAFDQTKNGNAGAKQADTGMLSFYTNMNRDRQVSTRATFSFTNDEDVLIIADVVREFTDGEIAAVREVLAAGKPVVVSVDLEDLTAPMALLLTELAPDLALQAGGGAPLNLVPDVEDNVDSITARIEGVATPIPSGIDPQTTFATFEHNPQTAEQPPTPYMVHVNTDWGEPLLRAKVGNTEVDVLRSKQVGGGELILMLQGGLFENRSLGDYLMRQTDEVRGATALQYALIDYLKVEGAAPPLDDQPDSRVCR